MLILLASRVHTTTDDLSHSSHDDSSDASTSTSALPSSLHSLWLTLLYCGLASLFLLACLILILYRKRQDDTTLLPHAAAAAATTPTTPTTHTTPYDTRAAQLWIGGDPTLPSPSLHSSPAGVAVPPVRERGLAEGYLLLASNVCRSLSVECGVLQSLPDIGHRTARYYCRVQHATLGECMMAVARVDDCQLVDYTQHKRFLSMRSLLASLQHPHVLPSLDMFYVTSPPTSPLPSHHYAFLQPLSPYGSLRDHLHTTLYSHPYATKYYTATHSPKHGTPLPIRHVRTFTRHILLALLYLRTRGIVHYGVHSGNCLLLKDGREARAVLCGVEGVLLGWRSRYHRKLRRLKHVDPVLASVALLVYEMCTGREAEVLRDTSTTAKGAVDLSLEQRQYADAADLIDLILYATHTVTLEELLTHRLCTTTTTSTPSTPTHAALVALAGGREERCEGKIVRKLLIPVHTYFVLDCYKRHPHTVADGLWYAREGGWLEGGMAAGSEGTEEGGSGSRRKKKHRHRKGSSGSVDAIV